MCNVHVIELRKRSVGSFRSCSCYELLTYSQKMRNETVNKRSSSVTITVCVRNLTER
jgi:hypothetical protein